MKLSNGLELTAEQESNLRKLAYYHLRGIECSPMGFTMETFFEPMDGRELGYAADSDTQFPSEHNVCGTVGCLIGHGPSAGIDLKDSDRTWWDYGDRCFINDSAYQEWDWCFNSEWANVDDTPAGGAKRILWLLERGLPADAFEQMYGEAPLCYADWSPDLPAEIAEPVPESVAI